MADVDRTTLRADDTDLAYVTLTLTDADGNVYRDRDRQVSVRVTGRRPPRARQRQPADPRTVHRGHAHHVRRPRPRRHPPQWPRRKSP
ncbi:hypothetical protein [Streptodolium elevatio]